MRATDSLLATGKWTVRSRVRIPEGAPIWHPNTKVLVLHGFFLFGAKNQRKNNPTLREPSGLESVTIS